MEPKIVYEDEALLVIDKPPGMAVNRTGLLKGACHRLDKETSGLLVIAKNPVAFAGIQKQFKQRQVKKKYLALVHGQLIPAKGIISASVGRSPFNRKKFGVFLGGKKAETSYKVIGHWSLVVGRKKEDFSLAEVVPKTGRTHQIRVHLKHIGHPVVGDILYAGRKQARGDRRWCKRQFLHANFLKLTHPATGKPIEFHSDLPADLQQVFARLQPV